MSAPILSIRNLTTSFRSGKVWMPVVKDLTFDIAPRETVAVVGESGSGKSVTALSIMRLVPEVNGRIEGQILLEGRDLVPLPESDMRAVRGGEISMIFQEPMTSLNPVLTVGFQIAETLRFHRGIGQAQAEAEALRILDTVRIPAAKTRFNEYPHRFSGGMRQRVMIAIALACRPRLLIADEPTTALDVTVQAQVLALIRSLQRELGMAVLFITHDLGVVAQMADRVAVMYAGRIVEEAPVRALFESPCHPYTQGLLRSMPNAARVMRGRGIAPIRGSMPSLTRLPRGCAFHPRCERAEPGRCDGDVPALDSVDDQRAVRCWRWREPALAATEVA